jgi:predicted MFS family arabinose efflux permease
MTAGQIGGGVLADLLGWRFAFWSIAALFAAAAGMLYQSMRRSAAAAAAANDGRAGPAAGGANGTSGYLKQCRLLFADRWALIVIGTVTLEGTLLFGAVALIASYLQRSFGTSASVAGTVSALFGLGGMFYALNARKLLTRLRAPGLCRAGGGLIAAGMVVLLLQTAWQWSIAAALMAGLGYYMLHNTLQTQATQLSTEARGAAISFFATGLWLGQGIGVSVAAAVAERFGFHLVFATTAVGLAALGLAFGRALDARQARLQAG